MAPPVANQSAPPDTLPPDFAQWDHPNGQSSAPPDTLPADFSGFDSAQPANHKAPTEAPGAIHRFLSGLWANTPNPVQALKGMASFYQQPFDAAMGTNRQAPQAFTPENVTNAVAGQLGLNLPDINQRRQSGDVAGALGAAAAPFAINGALAGAGGATEGLGRGMQASGMEVMNRLLGANAKSERFGANPAQGVMTDTPGVFMSKRGMASGIKQGIQRVGAQIGDAHAQADASGTLIHPIEVQQAVAPVIQKALRESSGLGAPDTQVDQVNHLVSQLAPYIDPGRTPMPTSELWEANQSLDRNTNWNDPSQRGINSIKQQLSAALGAIRDQKVPGIEDLNSRYQNLKEAQKALANKPSSLLSALPGVLTGGGELAATLMHGGPEAMAMAAAPLIAASTPARSGLASMLYRSGRILNTSAPAVRTALMQQALHGSTVDPRFLQMLPSPGGTQ